MLDIQTALEQTKSFTVPMTEIKVISRSVFEVKGNRIPITGTAFKDLLRLVGLTQKTVNHLNHQLQDQVGFALIKELMKAMSTKKGMNVSLLVDLESKEVKRICLEGESTGTNSALTPSAIEDLINYACNQSKHVKLADTFISDGGTKVAFNLRWDVPIALKMRGEDIKFGKQITWDLLSDTTVADFVEREICANGMTGIVPGKAKALDVTTTPSEWYQILFKDIVSPNKGVIRSYEHKVLDAMQTNLSVYEFNAIKSRLTEGWRDDTHRIVRYLGNEEWKLDYANRAIDLESLTAAQLRNCPTPVNAWTAINCMTDLASHSYTSVVPDRVRKSTQKFAGQLLNKTWDENQQVDKLPKYAPAEFQEIYN